MSVNTSNSRAPCVMRSDVYEDLKNYAESIGMKVYTLTNMLVETSLKMLKEGISPNEMYILYRVLDTLTRLVEIKPKGSWRELGRALGTILNGMVEEKDLNIAIMKTLEIIAMTKGSKLGTKTSIQFMFFNESDANEFEEFVTSLLETTKAKLNVERISNVIKLSSSLP